MKTRVKFKYVRSKGSALRSLCTKAVKLLFIIVYKKHVQRNVVESQLAIKNSFKLVLVRDWLVKYDLNRV